IARGVEFTSYPSLDAGFRVAAHGSVAQYDFSAEVVAQVLSARVNRVLAEYLKEASGSIA
ncbi:MAG: V-type ATP synthase subunit E, partial [Rectinema sp.]|nr:V-type ATP synthase subunit E [Rectinema sp.]